MIGVITIIAVCVVLLIKIYITNKENNIRIKELELRLTKYYKERERILKDKGLIND
jgi:hypothetical protein